MVNSLVVIESDPVVDTSNPISLDPKKVPVCLMVSLLPASVPQHVQNRVSERRAKTQTAPVRLVAVTALFPLPHQAVVVGLASFLLLFIILFVV